MTEKIQNNQKPGFEDALAQFEKIVAQLETGKTPLEDALRLHQEGMALKQHCSQLLREAEMRFEHIKHIEKIEPDNTASSTSPTHSNLP